MNKKKGFLGLLTIGVMSAALAAGGISAAQAVTGQSWYCSVTVATPALSSNKIRTSGSATSCSGSEKKLFVQVHRSVGITNPLVAQNTQSGATISYGPIAAQNCDPDGAHQYFGQVWMQATGADGTVWYTGNSSSLNPCDTV